VELQERAVRLSRSEQPRRLIAHLTGELGVHPEGLRNWIRQDETNRGERDDRLTTEQLEELRRANEILKAASRFSPPSSTVPGRGDPHERPASGSFRVRADLPGSCRRRPAPTRPQAPPASARDQRDDRSRPRSGAYGRRTPGVRHPQDLAAALKVTGYSVQP